MLTPSLIAAAIASAEGFYWPLSHAYNTKNPGNLLDGAGHHADFVNIESGWHGLMTHILDNAGMTLGEYLEKRARGTAYQIKQYVAEVCRITGYSPDAKMEWH